MIKKCLVLKHNEAMALVRFGDVLVQLPPMNGNLQYIYLNYEDEKYSVISEEEYHKRIEDENLQASKKKNSKRPSAEVNDVLKDDSSSVNVEETL